MIEIRDIKELSDNQSEAGIIATLIAKPDFLLYSEQLKPNHFFDMSNSCLFWAISELYKQKINNIDAYNLINTIESNKAIKKQFGEELTPDNINQILSMSTYIARDTAEEYKKIVKTVSELAYKRQIYKDLEKCKIDCFKEDISISDLHKNVQRKIDDAAVDFVTSEVHAYKDIVEDLWAETESRFDIGVDAGYSSKITSANEFFTYEPNELVLCAAQRKKGKSIFSLNEAVHKMKNGIGVVYFDTELTDRLFNERLLAHLSGVEFKRIKRGEFDEVEKGNIQKAIKWVKSCNFYHLHRPIWNKDEIYLIAKKLMKNHNATFFVYDHLKVTNSADSSTAYHELGTKVNFLKDIICGELGYAGLALAQLNRSGDIGDSFKLEQEVSTVINLIKKTEDEIIRDTPECGNYKLFVKANRNGNEMDDPDTEYIDMMFRGNLCLFENVKQHDSKDNPLE